MAQAQEQPGSGVLMFMASRHLEQRVFEGIAEAGYDDVTLAQGRLLARVDEAGSRLTALAESGQITKQTAGYLVDQLERLGYVDRAPDPRDARARLVMLSSRALALREIAREVEQQVEAEWAAHLGAARWRSLRASLASLRAVIDPSDP